MFITNTNSYAATHSISLISLNSYALFSQFAGTTTGALTNLIKVAKQPNRFKELKMNHPFTGPPTMANTLAGTCWTLRSYLTPILLPTLLCSSALTTPSQPNKAVPSSHLLSHHHHHQQQWKRSARRRFLHHLPMITCSLLSSLLIPQSLSLCHQTLTQMMWFPMYCMILLSLMMPLAPFYFVDWLCFGM